MEEQQQRQMKKKKKKSKGKIIKKKRKTQQRKPESNMLFSLLLAAISTNSNANKFLIKQCLNQLYLSLSQEFSSPIISLLPVLLNSNCAEIVCKSVEIIGALSLMSLESNEMISLDGEIVKGLILLLESTKRRISVAACNAILDLSTTAAGQRRLLELSAMDKLMPLNLCLE